MTPPSSKGSPERLFQEFAVVWVLHSAPSFVLAWSLRSESHLSVRFVALDFTRHDLPPATVDDMDSMSNTVLAHNLAYVVTQAMTYLAAGSHRVQRFNELEHAHSVLSASEKSVLEDVRSALEGQVESLTQANEGLMIQNEILERDLVDREQEFEVLRVDRNWLLHVGLVCMMDKILEHPKFTGGISRIRHAAFVAGKESGWANLKAQSSHSSALDDALLAFATMDFFGLLGLGHLDVDGVWALCAFDEGEDVVGDLGVGVSGEIGDVTLRVKKSWVGVR
uniref:Uncharacterized protein n=1 Tax=Lactuca sativa TaxID=4236 RepID=A0A9R1VFM6_LACSA|nr:hypothetical protein LSAT_V11C500256730 [Lactuca sativa]